MVPVPAPALRWPSPYAPSYLDDCRCEVEIAIILHKILSKARLQFGTARRDTGEGYRQASADSFGLRWNAQDCACTINRYLKVGIY